MRVYTINSTTSIISDSRAYWRLIKVSVAVEYIKTTEADPLMCGLAFFYIEINATESQQLRYIF